MYIFSAFVESNTEICLFISESNYFKLSKEGTGFRFAVLWRKLHVKSVLEFAITAMERIHCSAFIFKIMRIDQNF